MLLEELTNEPLRHPECCLNLSLKLFASLRQFLCTSSSDQTQNHTALSIGCGSGLFEALLQDYLNHDGERHIRVEGVEVQSKEVTYLSRDCVHRVNGTWDYFDEANSAEVLIFVYPRTGELVQQYLEKYTQHTGLVIWLGPVADWNEQEVLFSNIVAFGQPEVQADVGLASYEILVVFRRKVIKSEDD